MEKSAFDTNLDRQSANFEPLTPLTFMARCADVYPNQPAVIYGTRQYCWKEVRERATKLASALAARGIGKNDTVSIIAPNIPEMFEAHFGVAAAGAVLNPINTRLDAETIAYILDHSQAKVLITDTQFAPAVKQALATLANKELIIIDIDDRQNEQASPSDERLGETDYDTFIATGSSTFPWVLPDDEWNAISLNYTSGSTGKPKGVVCHHRGAYLMAVGIAAAWPFGLHPMHMYTVPLYHCNGWCHGWSLAVCGGTSVLIRNVNAANMYRAISDHRVTHFGCAPIVLSMLINASEEEKKPFDWPIHAYTAGAPPPSAILTGIEALGFSVTHVYGLTETYGHVVECASQPGWSEINADALAEIKARQGVRYAVTEGLMVADSETLQPVPDDGKTIGEIMIRGNTVMKGYFRNKQATDEAFSGGWFHTGDLAVTHLDGYVQIKDRLKDIIISGGENISSVEIENILFKHNAVMAAGVVAKPDAKWGEVPCAFVELKPGETATETEIIAHCRKHLAGFKCPKEVRFGELPKTSTGKIQKFVLRKQV